MASPGGKDEAVAFFLTAVHDCGYLPGRQAVNVVVDPGLAVGTRLYSRLAPLGFRRSGNRVYRPACPACAACVPLRVAVDAFRPQRTQRRIWSRNSDLLVRERPPGFDAEHYALYCRYIEGRHPNGGMEETTPDGYLGFISGQGIETRLIEFIDSGHCVAVAVTDVLADGLSAVYTYFDTAQARRSLGVYAVLWQIEAARSLGKKWLYLGYWIEDCRKMSYKVAYRPYELLLDGHWRRCDDPAG
ncbi:MAG: arginyltransferase [Gammaproteobacteria bacterium]|nr:arginyltransferase [Gammaproteobacteria bacterium]